MKRQSLKEQGAALPVPHKGLPGKDFAFKPWKLEQEKLIGQLKTKHKQAGVFIRQLFSEMLLTLGGQEWAKMDAPKRLLAINQMPMGNIFYLYIWLRMEAMGPGLNLGDIKCGNCGHKHPDFQADLESMQIRVKEEAEPDVVEVKLTKPFKLGDVQVTSLKLGYTPWDAMEKMDAADALNDGAVKEAMLMRSVQGWVTDAGEAALNTHEAIQHLSKRDLEQLTEVMDEHNAGPVLGLEFDCDKCGEMIERPLNWTYDHFFGNSSLPSRKKRSGRSSSYSSTTVAEV